MRAAHLLRRPVGLAGLGLLVIVLSVAVLGPILWGERATVVDTGNLLAGPSAEHWIGTDNLGRDLFYRVLVATRLSILLALGATAISIVLGLVLGAAPMLAGPRLGRVVTWAVNVLVAFPGLLLVLFFAVVFGVGERGAALAVGLAGAPSFARLCHTLIAGVSERDYIAAARIAGVSRLRILRRHVLPNIAEPLIVNATMGAGGVLLSFAGLSFLGLGVQAPSYDWGKLMQDGLNGIYTNPWPRSGPASPSSSRGWRSTSRARPWRPPSASARSPAPPAGDGSGPPPPGPARPPRHSPPRARSCRWTTCG
ncbi:ABC transporter permease [Nonomuraea rubra]|uniref:ABC transporter permease n=1 Tax=Nonomuraea rubra TaxID=46180 RepID=UPI00361838BE